MCVGDFSVFDCLTSSSHAYYVFVLFCRKQAKRPGISSNFITKFLFLPQSPSYCTWVQMLARQFQTTLLSLKRKTRVKVRLKPLLFVSLHVLLYSYLCLLELGVVKGA